MRIPHTPYHWIVVALVAAAFLLALSEAHGQVAGASKGAAAAFEGRPSMPGAQAGQGAQAGSPTGGIGVQGGEDLGLPLRKDIGKPKPKRELAPPKDTRDVPKDGVSQPRDSGLAKDQRSAAKKGRSAAKSTLRRSGTGVGEIGARGGGG